MNKKLFLIGLGCAAVFVFSKCAGTKSAKSEITGQTPKTLEKKIKTDIKVNYLFYLPEDYNTSGKKYPLVLFLHGAGERGSDLNFVKRHGPPRLVNEGKHFPFILVSPQCPEDQRWNTQPQIEILDQLIKHVQKNYAVDDKRIYITGLSMGGFGTWKMLETYPTRFAAAVPICGGGDSSEACSYKDVPIWNFHGAKDQVVKIEQSEKMINALRVCGGDPKYTIYPDAGHDSWTDTYNNAEVFEWMLDKKNKN